MSYSSFRRKIKTQVAADMQLIASSIPATSSSVTGSAPNLTVVVPVDVAIAESDLMNDDIEDVDIVLPELINVGLDADGHQNEMIFSDLHSLSSDSDEFADKNIEMFHSPLDEQLSQWAEQFHIPLSATSALLSILKPYHPSLPSNRRTLLRTPTSVKVRTFQDGGEYCHSGIASGILVLCKDQSLSQIQCLELQFNIDGLPLFKSSSTALWPILCLIKQLVTCGPFVVGLYSGAAKPTNVNEFLNEFALEALSLVNNGIRINELELMPQGLRLQSELAGSPIGTPHLSTQTLTSVPTLSSPSTATGYFKSNVSYNLIQLNLYFSCIILPKTATKSSPLVYFIFMHSY